MSTMNLREETSDAIYGWRTELSALIASRLQELRPALRKVCVRDDPALLRLAVGNVLAILTAALQLEDPEYFVNNIVSNRSALAAIVMLSLVDGSTVLTKISDTLQLYLPGPHGKLSAEYVRYGLMRLNIEEHQAA
jgi:hypothetical protein